MRSTRQQKNNNRRLSFAEKYLAKQSFRTINISRAPDNSELLKYIVIIPAYCEPGIKNTLQSVLNTNPVGAKIEVYVLINYPDHCSIDIKNQNITHYEALCDWSVENSTTNICIYPLLAKDLPRKHAGAGMARKLLMDWACKRFEENSSPGGIILSLDADTLVPKDYFSSLEECKKKDDKASCFIFNFAHPTRGLAYTSSVYSAITQYEMHLRYYRHMLKRIEFPYFHYTIGSCFAVEALAYVKAGGMNKRKAGEDFYFLQKVFPNNKTVFLSQTILTPSARPSWRVPFGTGPTIRKISGSITGTYNTYNPKSFLEVKLFIKLIPSFYSTVKADEFKGLIEELPIAISSYLKSVDFSTRLSEVKQNSASLKSFEKRFYQWFDAFALIKFLNHAREFHPDIDVCAAVSKVFNLDDFTAIEILEFLRKKDRETIPSQ